MKTKYSCCTWCGADIPNVTPHAMYCSLQCRYIASGKK